MLKHYHCNSEKYLKVLVVVVVVPAVTRKLGPAPYVNHQRKDDIYSTENEFSMRPELNVKK